MQILLPENHPDMPIPLSRIPLRTGVRDARANSIGWAVTRISGGPKLNHYRDLWRDSPEARPTSSYNAA